MEHIKNEDFSKQVNNIISERHQIKNSELHLTVYKIFKIQGKGTIDFGGSEEKKAKVLELEPAKKNPEDKYGWWELEQGTYIIKINEKINLYSKNIAIISPLTRTINAGAYISTKLITQKSPQDISLILITLNGINIKENARIAKMVILKI